MNVKRVIIPVIMLLIIFIGSNSFVYATGSGSRSGTSITTDLDTTPDDDWVANSFSAAKEFLEEQTQNSWGIMKPIFDFLKNLIKGANRVLFVALTGLSIIALSIVGVRYIASGASPGQREIAKQSLHTIFIGMAFGFGAFAIWKIAMAIIKIMIGAFT